MIQKRFFRNLNLILVVIMLLTAVACFMGCSFTRHAIAALQSTDHFVPSPSDVRVLYESGAQGNAEKIASILPSAVQHIEKAQYLTFEVPIRVYVCASEENFRKQYGNNAKAGVLLKKIFLSPRLFELEDDDLKQYLLHELSHLHLFQRLGTYKQSRIPAWFREGLATYVSDGGGAELATHKQAVAYIRSGKHFILHKADGFIFKNPRSDFDMHQHMFYRQSMMFVNYLISIDYLKFKKLLLAVEDGEPFSVSVHEAYQKSIDDLWRGFLQTIS